MTTARPSGSGEPSRPARADAQRNRAHIIDVARVVVTEEGTQASLREISRRSGVGLGTLYRHFPTRDALLEALLNDGFERLAERATTLQATRPPDDALLQWLQEFVAGTNTYRGLATSMMMTLENENSSLHASCQAMRAAGARLLKNAQEAGTVRADVDGTDLFALAGAMSWIGDQAATIATRQEHLLTVIAAGLKRPR